MTMKVRSLARPDRLFLHPASVNLIALSKRQLNPCDRPFFWMFCVQ